ncbi:excitatory amino acid transporter 1-like [Diorhabda sublineata]|uniref:excitatory amino acid transporter 1-like n=1 Tax=Diorhabda sublineata TaxID=1163346 RepID=UPI0024E11E30|nr:excitatory amino acid transporter 1-like [Diorhabda sublineata]XP_056634011.1 excitatory amino acid transporter 1-like [Diorhabda sublineata]XP_056634012.1 excitatory amino acid transporter 1-like [Diorhabda sublineata]XP_056634013.1 excitatory amino acid transporter 1-like [Diorhabda sublineata]XP_056634014.1 excitatory amino acid transporter 1-like [Diorhabda sublineata]XP_056634015.1 excitatory amino acid transporter 1-like [Diorhabda sublineata]XP_056634017.1 excitatory amino acid tran
MAPHHHNFEIIEADNCRRPKSKLKSFLKQNGLTLATMVGVILGTVLGIILKYSKDSWSEREVMYIGFAGQIFLRMLKVLILPLIISSLISAIAGLDLSLSGKIAARAVAYYLTTTFAAVVLGMVVVMVIRPGVGVKVAGVGEGVKRNVSTVDTLLDLVRNMFPPNMAEATIFQTRTVLVPTYDNDTGSYINKIDTEIIQNTNIMGLVVIAAALGIAIAQLGEEAKIIATFFHNLMAVSMKITSWVIFLSPLGIIFLVSSKVLEMEDVGNVMAGLGWYFATVCTGLFVQGFVILPLLYLLLTRKNPIAFILNMSQAVVTAFGTASSSATLPLTIRCLEEKNGVDRRVARFALPIGATINLDGTALYEAVAAIFIAQVREVPLDFGTLVAISLTATAASIGAAGIPQAGLVTMVMVLDTVGLPAEDVTLILAVDWLLDRFRTAINVMGDSFGAGIVYHRSLRELGVLVPTEISSEDPPDYIDGEATTGKSSLTKHEETSQ